LVSELRANLLGDEIDRFEDRRKRRVRDLERDVTAAERLEAGELVGDLLRRALERVAAAKEAHVHRRPVHAVDQDRNAERAKRRTLSAGFLPEAPDALGALAEGVVVHRARVPAVAEPRDSAVGAIAGGADVERRGGVLRWTRRWEDGVQSVQLCLAVWI